MKQLIIILLLISVVYLVSMGIVNVWFAFTYGSYPSNFLDAFNIFHFKNSVDYFEKEKNCIEHTVDIVLINGTVLKDRNEYGFMSELFLSDGIDGGSLVKKVIVKECQRYWG